MAVVPRGDFASYIVGAWKRTLEWRQFGGAFPLLKATNMVVVVEDVTAATSRGDPPTAGTRFLRWSFGRSLSRRALRTGYTTQVIPDGDNVFMQFNMETSRCVGNFRTDVCVATLSFFMPGATITVTYRPVDTDTMAVSIVETTLKATPTLQYGTMYRLKPELYRSLVDDAVGVDHDDSGGEGAGKPET